MQMHMLQTGTVKIKQRQQQGSGSGLLRLVNTLRDSTWTPALPIYAWVIEHPEGVIVVDTGETARTAERGYLPQWHPYYRFGVQLSVQPQEEIGPQLQALGIRPVDVRWVVLTHLHTDHAGGLYHFPKSQILVSAAEYRAARGLNGRINGYLNQHWPEWFQPRLVDYAPQPIGAFAHSMALTQAEDVYIVPTPGHTPGHQSVIVQTAAGTLFMAGDVAYTETLMQQGVIDGVTADVAQSALTLQRTRDTVQATDAVYLASHDPDSARRWQAYQQAQIIT